LGQTDARVCELGGRKRKKKRGKWRSWCRASASEESDARATEPASVARGLCCDKPRGPAYQRVHAALAELEGCLSCRGAGLSAANRWRTCWVSTVQRPGSSTALAAGWALCCPLLACRAAQQRLASLRPTSAWLLHRCHHHHHHHHHQQQQQQQAGESGGAACSWCPWSA